MALRFASKRLGERALQPPLQKMKLDFGLAQGEEVQVGFAARFTKLAVEGSGGPTFVHKQRMTQLSTYDYSPVKKFGFSSHSMQFRRSFISSPTHGTPQHNSKVAVKGSTQPCFIHNYRIPSPSGFAYSPLKKFGFSSNSVRIQRPFIGIRSKSTSSRSSAAPAEEFTFYIRGGRMSTKHDIDKDKCMILVRGDEDLCMVAFWYFVRSISKGGWPNNTGETRVITKFHNLSETELDYQLELLRVKETSALYAKLQKWDRFILEHLTLYCGVVGMLLLLSVGEFFEWQIPGDKPGKGVGAGDKPSK